MARTAANTICKKRKSRYLLQRNPFHMCLLTYEDNSFSYDLIDLRLTAYDLRQLRIIGCKKTKSAKWICSPFSWPYCSASQLTYQHHVCGCGNVCSVSPGDQMMLSAPHSWVLYSGPTGQSALSSSCPSE